MSARTAAPHVDWKSIGQTVLLASGVFPCSPQSARNAQRAMRMVLRSVRRSIYAPTWMLQRQVCELRFFGRQHPEWRPYYWVLAEAIRLTHPPRSPADYPWDEFDMHRERLDKYLSMHQRKAG